MVQASVISASVPKQRTRTFHVRSSRIALSARTGPGRPLQPNFARPHLRRVVREQKTVECQAVNDSNKGWGIGKLLDSVGALFRFGGEPGQNETVAELDRALASHVEVPAVRGVIQRRLEDEVVQELTSFPLDKLASGRCPSQAVFVRIPSLPETPGSSATSPSLDNWTPPQLFGWPAGTVVVAVRGILMVANAALVGSGARRDAVSVLLPEDSGLKEALLDLWPAAPFSFLGFEESLDESFPTGTGTCSVVVTLAASPPAATTLHADALPVLARLQATKTPFILAVVYMDGTAAEAAGSPDLSPAEASYLRRRARGQTRALVEGNTRLLLERLARAGAQGQQAGDAETDAAAAERRATSAAASGSGAGGDAPRAGARRGKGAAAPAQGGGGGGALDSIFRTAVGALGGGGAAGGGPRGRASPALMEALRAAVLAPRVSIPDLKRTIEEATGALAELSRESEVGDAPLALAIQQAEGRLAAAEVESVLEAALEGAGSKTVAALPKLEAAAQAAAALARQGPLISEMVASRLNRLCARVDGRVAALRQTAEASAALAAALPPGAGSASAAAAAAAAGPARPGQLEALEAAVATARLCAWPWQIAAELDRAQEVLELWRALAEVQQAADARSQQQLSLAIRKVASRWPEADLAAPRRLLSSLEASAALERGDTRLAAYFAAVRTVWGGGAVSTEGAAILAELRDTLRITPAEHEQVLIASGVVAAGAGAGEAEQPAAAAAAKAAAANAEPAQAAAAAAPPAREDPAAAAAAPASSAVAAPRAPSGGFVGASAQELAAATAPPTAVDPIAAEPSDAEPSAAAAAQQALQLSEEGGCWRQVGPNLSYNEEEVLGVGSRGTYVFRGWVSVTSRQRHPVAVKRVVRPPGVAGRRLVELVEREVELLTALNQSQLVPFFHTWALNDVHVFIAYELCPESLAEFVVRQPELPLEERLRLFREAAAALAWLHDPRKPQGAITHNDLKPENLLIGTTGAVKLADIGLGVRLQSAAAAQSQEGGGGGDGADGAGDGAYSLSTFRSYGVDINLHGRAPEVLLQRRLTPSADVWALGLVAYFVLTGRPSPFVQEGAAPLPAAVTDERILQGRFDLSALMTLQGQPRTALEARLLIASMLSPEPSERPTAAQVAEHPVFWPPTRVLEAAKELHSAGGDPDAILLRLSTARRPAGAAEAGSPALGAGALGALGAGGRGVGGVGGGGGARAGGAGAGQCVSIAAAERAALLAASLFDLQGWTLRVDPALRERIFSYAAPGEAYTDTFDSLLRFCRNAWEHPPAAGEVPALMRSLYEATGVPPRRPKTLQARRELVAQYLLALFPGLAIAVHAVTPEVAAAAAARGERPWGGGGVVFGEVHAPQAAGVAAVGAAAAAAAATETTQQQRRPGAQRGKGRKGKGAEAGDAAAGQPPEPAEASRPQPSAPAAPKLARAGSVQRAAAPSSGAAPPRGVARRSRAATAAAAAAADAAPSASASAAAAGGGAAAGGSSSSVAPGGGSS